MSELIAAVVAVLLLGALVSAGQLTIVFISPNKDPVVASARTKEIARLSKFFSGFLFAALLIYGLSNA